MKRVLLLGANGQLGTDLVGAAAEYKNVDLIALKRADFDAEKHNPAAALALYRSFDAVVNCISFHKTDECESSPEKTFQLNAFFALHLGRLCAENNQTLFQISTDYVFDGVKGRPYIEDDPVNPLNIYGASKAASEFFVRHYVPRHFIFRVASLFGVAGASGKGGNFIETMIRLAREGKPIKVVNDQFMSPTHSRDVARAIFEFIDNDIEDYGTYHAVNGGAGSWFELATAVFEMAGIDADLQPIRYEDYQTKAKRPRYSVLDNSRLTRIVAMPHWKVALKNYLQAKGYLTTAVRS